MRHMIGDKNIFAIGYSFYNNSHDTEIAMYVDGKNILAFERDDVYRTTKWNLDELALWLRNFLDNLTEDPYPVECEGEFAAQKDSKAREFDSDDENIFDEYYDKLYAWDIRHRWHSASSGAVLADVFFQLVGDNVEVSWDNRYSEGTVTFQSEMGGFRVPRNQFVSIVDSFLQAYADQWYRI